MYVCLFLYGMYILYKHTGPDTCHIHRTWQSNKHLPRSTKQIFKTRPSTTARQPFKNNPRQRKKLSKYDTPPTPTPTPEWTASSHIHQDHHASVCVCVRL